jgi:hypothetical protein
MLGLVRQALRPSLGLQHSVEDWYSISCLLREPPRRRAMQVETITKKSTFLS